MSDNVPAQWPQLASQPSLAPNQKALLAVVVLAFSQSKMREVVGKEALAMVLEGQLPGMTRKAGVLELEPLWSLLNNQPGFNLADAVPPMLAIKGWEPHLGVYVELPLAFTDANAMEVWQHTRSLSIPSSEVEAALRGHLDGVEQERETLVATPMRQPPKLVVEPPRRRAMPTFATDISRRVPVWKAALALAATGAMVGGIYVFTLDQPPPEIPVEQLPPGMAGAHVQAVGDGLLITLPSTDWAQQSEDEQTTQLRAFMDAPPQAAYQRASVLAPGDKVVAVYVRRERGRQVTVMPLAAQAYVPTSDAPGEAPPPVEEETPADQP